MSKTTSWEAASDWYQHLVGKDGHYYHQHVIFPKLIEILKTKKQNQSLLDLGCGGGSLFAILQENYTYDGVDLSASLLKAAKKEHKNPRAQFHEHDLCAPFDLKKTFTHASMILSLQNIESPEVAFQNAKNHLKQGGTFIIVLNHPYFRIPRQSSWGVDERSKIQYRRVDSYMSLMRIPIDMHPSFKEKVQTYSFHYPLSYLFAALQKTGFAVTSLAEWTTDKLSTGKNAKMENRAKQEFPLFMCLVAKSL